MNTNRKSKPSKVGFQLSLPYLAAKDVQPGTLEFFAVYFIASPPSVVVDNTSA